MPPSQNLGADQLVSDITDHSGTTHTVGIGPGPLMETLQKCSSDSLCLTQGLMTHKIACGKKKLQAAEKSLSYALRQQTLRVTNTQGKMQEEANINSVQSAE